MAGSFARTTEVLRMFPRAWPMAKLARLEAEALVWRHGIAGVEAAQACEKLARDKNLEVRLYAWLVRFFAKRHYAYLAACDTATRYDVGAAWARRPSQMNRSDG